MKKLFSTLSLVLGVSMLAQAQLVISEIMFNPPESGADSLEFIEIYNASANPIDLDGHYIVFGGSTVRDSFNGSFVLPAGGLVVTAVNDSASFNQYNMSSYPRQWRSNAGLSNTGSTIRLHNSTGAIIDSVAYTSTWQSQAAGNGSSIILCNPAADNNVSTNWSFSATSTGNTINTRPLSGSPGVLESCPVINYPLYTISQINGLNANGAPDSANVYCEIRAIVHSGDFRGGAGYDFAFINSNNVGITAFVLANVGGYTVTQGDSLHLRGFVTQFNGTLQFTPDSILVASAGNTLVTPMVTTVVNETTENKLVKLENVVLVDTVNTSPAGLTIRVRNATDTFDIRIDNDVNAFGATLLTDSFNIIGVGRQNDVMSPYDSTYQVLVRGISDFEFLGAVAVQRIENTLELKLFPNPTNQTLFVQTAAVIENIVITNAIGQQVAQANNVQQQQAQINTANLPAGIYQATIRTDKGTESRRFVVQH
jgi:hypothetical protein